MKCRILNYDAINKIYVVETPEGKTIDLQKNTGRNLMIGKNSASFDLTEAFYYSNETGTSIDLEPAAKKVDVGGYVVVELVNCGKDKEEWMHRMVAYSWIPGYDSKKDHVDHVNGDKQDNRLENLETVPSFYNAAKEFRNKNSRAKEYMMEAIRDPFRMADYDDLVSAMKYTLRKEDYIVTNELSKDLTEEDIKRLVYLMDRLGYDVKKRDK
jgi:hypothetical protein